MTQSNWSFMGSELMLWLDDDIATLYNECLSEYYAAQTKYREKHQRPWNYKESPLEIHATKAQLKAYEQVGRLINLLIEINGPLNIPEESLTSNYLVKLELPW